jgi:hypothetical protein
MNEAQDPEVEHIKIRLGEDIPVEDEPAAMKVEEPAVDLVDELRRLGKQFGETMQAAWQSQERVRLERELKEGFRGFATEVDKAFKDLKESPPVQKVGEEAAEVKTRVESGEVAEKTRAGIAQGLGWLSQELAKLADQFSPAEKAPDDVEPTDAPPIL